MDAVQEEESLGSGSAQDADWHGGAWGDDGPEDVLPAKASLAISKGIPPRIVKLQLLMWLRGRAHIPQC